MAIKKSLKRISFLLVFLLVLGLFPANCFNIPGASGTGVPLFGGAAHAVGDPEEKDFMRAFSLYSVGRYLSTFYSNNPEYAFDFRSSLTPEEENFLQFVMPMEGELVVEIYDYSDLGLSAPIPDRSQKPIDLSDLDPLPASGYVPAWSQLEADDPKPVGYLYGEIVKPAVSDGMKASEIAGVVKPLSGEYRAFDGDDTGYWDPSLAEVSGGVGSYNFIKWKCEYVPYDDPGAYDPSAAPEPLEAGKYLLVFNYTEDDKTESNARYLPINIVSGSPEEQMQTLLLFDLFVAMMFPEAGWLRLCNPLLGDPVSLLSGALQYSYTDLSLEGKDSLELTRTYMSTARSNDFGFGYGWAFPFSYRIKQVYGTAIVALPTGGNISYERLGGEWVTAPGNTWSLESAGGGFLLRSDTGDKVEFDGDGYATSISNNSGYEITLANENGELRTSSSRTGSFEFEWADGHITKVTDSAGRSVTYAYAGGRLSSTTNPDLDTLEYIYDETDNLLSVRDFRGNVYLENAYDEIGRVTEQYQAERGWARYEYDDENRTNTYTDENGKITKVVYDEDYRITTQADNDGTIEYAYDDMNRLVLEKNKRGGYTEYEYIGDTTLYGSITYPDGSYEQFEYDESGRVTKHRKKDGAEFFYGYDEAAGDLLWEKDGNGGTRAYGYENGYMVWSKDALGFTTVYENDPMGNVVRKKDPLGNEWLYDYDDAGRLTMQESPLGNRYEYAYTDAGKLEYETDPLGNTRETKYTGNGYVETEQDFRGNAAGYSYNINNQSLSMSDREGKPTFYEYDIAGNLMREEGPDGHVKRYGYDPMGRVIWMTDGNGNTTNFSYDGHGNLIAAEKPLGGGAYFEEAMGYSPTDLMTSLTNGRGFTVEYGYDLMGRLKYEKDAENNETKYSYDGNGNLTGIVDANNGEALFGYDAENRLVKTVTPEGNVTEYFYDGAGRLETVRDARGGETKLSYDKDGNPVREESALGAATGYEYDEKGRVKEARNADGGSVFFEYDENGNLTRQIDAEGFETLFGYDRMDRLTKTTDANGGETEMAYTDGGNLASVKRPEGDTVSYAYDGNDNPIEEKDGRGNTAYYSYDALNRLSSVKDREGNVTGYEYDNAGNLTKERRPDGGVVSYVFDKADRNSSVTDGEGNTTVYGYDGKGNATKQANPRGGDTVFAYDKDDQLVSVTTPLGLTTGFEYDGTGNMVARIDPAGGRADTPYDLDGKLEYQSTPLGLRTSFEYDDMGRLTKQTNPDGTYISYTYNLNGWALTLTDARGNTESYGYDNMGRLVSIADREGHESAYAYDGDGRRIASKDQKGGETKYSFDGNGNIIAARDARGNATEYAYDKDNKLIGTHDPEGGVTGYGYDGLGNLTKTIRPEGGMFTNEYYLNDWLKSETDALGNTASREYDGNGNMVSYTDRRGYTKYFEYDADDRLIKIVDTLDAGTGSEKAYITEYVYDSLGHVIETINALGDSSGSAYDADGRATEDFNELAEEGTPVHRVKYGYDLMGRITKRTFEDGSYEEFTYDENGNVTSKTDERRNTTRYEYDRNDRLVKATDPMQGVTAYAYTPTGQVEKVTDAEGGVTRYEYDENDNITKAVDPEGHAYIYGYDKNNRVISATDPRGAVTGYAYDKNSNLKEVSNPDEGLEKYSYDLNDQMVSYTDGEGFTTLYAYDENGDLVKATDPRGNDFTKEYDELGRVTKTVNEEGGIVLLAYDGLGNLVQAVNEDGAVTKYTYDAKSRLVATEDAYGNFKRFEYDPRDRVTAITDENGVRRTYTYDAKGNLVGWVDGLGEMEKYSYDKNGNMLSFTDRNGGATYYTYDLLDRATSEKDPLGNTKYFTYDRNSRITAVKDRNGNATQYVLDGNGNIVETIDAKGHSSFFEYDPMDRLSKATLNRVDAIHGVDEMQETLYYYDKRGLVKKEVNARGDGKLSIYDGNGNLAQETDEDGNITEYGYSPVNLAAAVDYADGKSASFLYNGTGELIGFSDWNGDTGISRDLLNRILSVNDHNSKETRYGYDPVGNVIAIGYPDGGQVDYYYDEENRITTLVDVVEGVYGFTYDPNGNMTSKEYPNFEASRYYYDANNRPVEMDEFELGGKKALATLYEWDPNGNLLSEKSYTHGTSKQIAANTGAGSGTGDGNSHRGEWRVPPPMSVLEDGTVVNPGGNEPPGLQRGGLPGKAANPDKPGSGALGGSGNGGLKESRVFTYDALDYMATGTIDGTKTEYAYDSVGNLVKEKIGAGNTAVDYQYNVMNQLVRKQTNSEMATYAYDKRGNRTGEAASNKTQSYVYDATNHLVRGVNVNGDASEYAYNALFMRVNNTQVAHSGSAYSRDYVIDYTSGDENNDIVTYAHGEYCQQQVYLKSGLRGVLHGEQLMQLTDTSASNSGNGGQERRLNIHEDPLGTTKKFTKGDGTEFAALKYDTWGLPAQPNKLVNNDHGNYIAANFTGHSYDTVLDFYFAEARFYDPMGRIWVARDPAKDGLNWYRYVGNNPASKWDQTGLAASYFQQVRGSDSNQSWSTDAPSIGNWFVNAWGWLSDKSSYLWNTHILGIEEIVVTNIQVGMFSITTHAGGNIFVPTVTTDSITGLKATGWKFNSPTYTIGSMEIYSGLVYAGDSIGLRGSVYDTNSGAIFELRPFYNDKGLNISAAAGTKEVYDEGVSVKTLTAANKLVTPYSNMAKAGVATGIVAGIVLLAIAGEAATFGAASPGIVPAAIASAATVLATFGLDDMRDDLGKLTGSQYLN